MNLHSEYRGRMAPTTSGLLHAGHERTFRTAWNRAKERNGKIFLRIDDIDFERCRPEYESAAICDLISAGLVWDGEIARQSSRIARYWSILKRLSALGLVYPSDASRSQAGKSSVFPKSLRRPAADADDVPDAFKQNWRFCVPDGKSIKFLDNNLGEQSFTAGKDFGDFLVWRKIGAPSYELASAVDDIDMEISEVVRGEDLLVSTARQLLIYAALGEPPPEFFHCPLLLSADGKKISKSSMSRAADNPLLMRNLRRANS